MARRILSESPVGVSAGRVGGVLGRRGLRGKVVCEPVGPSPTWALRPLSPPAGGRHVGGAPREPGGTGSAVGFLSEPKSSERQGGGRLWSPLSAHGWFPGGRGLRAQASDCSHF